MSTNIKYRPDIDGLRAIAVLLVVFNHAGFSAFSGGYIGVDVFFVISGFLITRIILEQIEKGRFSLYDFYIRRARRILPALYAVLIAVMIAGYFFYLPSDYTILAQSTLSAILFASNIFFWKSSGGYFSASAEEMPLLHIWSLSVEEQFYFVWPFALILALKLKSNKLQIAITAFILATSFALAEIGIRSGWTSTYFLLPSRAGELLVGALLASWLHTRRPNSTRKGLHLELASIAGALMIIIPAFYLSKNSSFPGLNALIPCLGAAIVIGSRAFGETLVSKLLSVRPLVFVGLISYSVYLWHWPLISFIKYSKTEVTSVLALSLVLASIALGYLSWRFIEQSFRGGATLGKKPFAFVVTTGALITVSLPVTTYLNDGFPSRFPYALLTQEQLEAERSRYWNGITTKTTEFSATAHMKKVAVIGNSHAYDFSYALTENGFDGQIKLIETSFYCFNFSNNYVWTIKQEECKTELRRVLSSPELKTADAIYMHDNWGGKNLSGLEEMIMKVRDITHAPIYIIGPKMIFSDTALNISMLAQNARHITPDSINKFARQYEDTARFTYDAELKNFFLEKMFPNTTYISALDAQCGSEKDCKILSDSGDYLYFDQGHFTLEGSRQFGKTLKTTNQNLF